MISHKAVNDYLLKKLCQQHMLLIYSQEEDGCGQNVPEKLPEKAEIRERS